MKTNETQADVLIPIITMWAARREPTGFVAPRVVCLHAASDKRERAWMDVLWSFLISLFKHSSQTSSACLSSDIE